ncbi:MAG: hypothetical protein WBN45_13705 [Arenicellales bacterium]|jgi:hypothetical protein
MKARLKPIVIGSLISLVLLASFPIIAVAGKLNADEVKQLVSGNTLVFRVVEGYEGGRKETRYYDANGTFRQFRKKANKTVKGTWSINDKGELCNSTKKRGACHIIYKQGNVWETYVETRNPAVPDKHILTIEKVLKGNPNDL